VKWLIINTEAFSVRGLKQKKTVTFDDLPLVVRIFLSAFPAVFVIGDESSKLKCNAPVMEHKKSSRTRLIKLLGAYAEEKCIMTATLKSKSPVNVYDQFQFLDRNYFPESMYEFAERYTIRETLRASRGKRVLITKKSYDDIRASLSHAWRRGGEPLVAAAIEKLSNRYGINYQNIRHIMEHQAYDPFINQRELLQRISPVTLRIKRADVFDITHDRFVKNPIMRPVELSAEAKRIANALVNTGFTDRFALGRTPALELLIRLQDVCNGFEPVEEPGPDGEAPEKRNVTYRPFPENPKLDALMELLDEIGVEEHQVVVWSSRTPLINACADRLTAEGVSFVVYDGGVAKAGKAEVEALFVSRRARVFLANQASGAYGLNCLAACAYAVYIGINDSVEQYYQSLHRILRGQLREPKFAYHIYTKGTVEERQLMSLALGRELIEERNSKEVFLCV
jgi:SNF2 family DNA or RNA helicase